MQFADEIDLALREIDQKDLLRFITCGSVDDGKSTLIGRLLLDTGAVYDDQFAALRGDSARHGTTGEAIDPALLLDGLEDERQQGITIDVAYRYFQTPRRKFIIADCPGHEQYTRNMATAASTAELAVILVDARKGMLPQTRRHSYIAALLGVRRIVLAVNKMDLVDCRQQVFEGIVADFLAFSKDLQPPHAGPLEIQPIPLSGLFGDNVVVRSQRMPWYAGPSLLEHLEQVPRGTDRADELFRFPVQRVSRPGADFRGYAGRVVSGTVRRGDPVVVLPAGKTSRIRSIVTFDGELDQADRGSAVTLTLEEELDIARGDMLATPAATPGTGRCVEATLVWMSQQPLVPGRSYWLKHTTRRTSGEVSRVHYRTDVNTLQRQEAATLRLNEIGRCELELHDPLVFDPYWHNRATGAFILVDRVSHETVAAGMIADPGAEDPADHASHWGLQLSSRRLEYTPSRISSERRRQGYGHAPLTVLLTGLSGAGKTTLALELEERMFAAGRVVMVLDGQNLRHGISRELGFSAEERSENLRRAAEIARLVNDAGIICIAAFVAPDPASRAKARRVIGAERLLHVHLVASLDTCRQRDTSGRYAAAERGEIANFPGVSSSYEIPEDADLLLHSDDWPVQRCAAEIEKLIVQRLENSRA